MPPSPRPILPLWAALPVSAGAGALLTLAFPAVGWWWIVFAAVPLALVPLIGRRVGTSILVGFAFGATFFLINVSFTARYLGPIPWLALSMLEAALTAVASIGITLAYRWMPRLAPGRWGSVLALPALVAALWTMREQLLGTFPYGGFPWGRVGVTQAAGPLAETASWVGMSGLSFLIVFACASGLEYIRRARMRDAAAALPAVATLFVVLLVPQFPTTPGGSIRVGAVQGNGPAGYFDDRGPNDVLNAQLAATEPLVGEEMDVLLWPEGGVDSDPTRDPVTAEVLDGLSERIDAPLLVAAVTERGDEYFNSSLVWPGDGTGAAQTYDKRHPVPFGEYVPDRWLFGALAPDLIGLIQREYTPGVAPPVVAVGVGGDEVGIGLAICFDVIYDDVIWDGVDGGAEVLMFQTNNADFRGTDENLQQLAFARMRAVETGRAVVNLSTVGTSQVIAPNGRTVDSLGVDEAGYLLVDVPLRTGLTPAVVAGPVVHLVLGWGSVAVLAALGVIVMLRARRPGR